VIFKAWNAGGGGGMEFCGEDDDNVIYGHM